MRSRYCRLQVVGSPPLDRLLGAWVETVNTVKAGLGLTFRTATTIKIDGSPLRVPQGRLRLRRIYAEPDRSLRELVFSRGDLDLVVFSRSKTSFGNVRLRDERDALAFMLALQDSHESTLDVFGSVTRPCVHFGHVLSSMLDKSVRAVESPPDSGREGAPSRIARASVSALKAQSSSSAGKSLLSVLEELLEGEDDVDQKIVEMLHDRFGADGATIDQTWTACADLGAQPLGNTWFVPFVCADHADSEARLVRASLLADPLGLADVIGVWMAVLWCTAPL